MPLKLNPAVNIKQNKIPSLILSNDHFAAVLLPQEHHHTVPLSFLLAKKTGIH
uniref:Uncharacterized protein n=1 Tax=Anguilla anguilla TaxID=7936 RepID=A0A0E9SKD9_ANGAN